LNYTREVVALSRHSRWLQGSVEKKPLLIRGRDRSPFSVYVVKPAAGRKRPIAFSMLSFETPDRWIAVGRLSTDCCTFAAWSPQQQSVTLPVESSLTDATANAVAPLLPASQGLTDTGQLV